MRKTLFVLGLIVTFGMSVFAQDWSEYSRGSENWHRHNRDALFHPWKYDKGGRLKRGKHFAKHAKHRKHH